MEPIRITFLGTASSIPTKKRAHTAILLTYKNENILIDCGEGTQRQFKFADLSFSKLTKILLTHWHGDHVLGLPGLFQTLIMNDFPRILDIYGPQRTPQFVQELTALFNLKIKLNAKEARSTFFDSPEFYLEALPMSHGIPSLGYSFVIKDKRRLDPQKLKKLKLPNSPLFKDLQNGKDILFNNKKIKSKEVSYIEKGRKVTIILDTLINENAIKLSHNSDLLICESSFADEEKAKAKEYMHLTATDAATIAKKAKVKSLILTHISERYEHAPQIILNEAKKIFKNVSLAKDFDVVDV